MIASPWEKFEFRRKARVLDVFFIKKVCFPTFLWYAFNVAGADPEHIMNAFN
jgi:hypothetical protein